MAMHRRRGHGITLVEVTIVMALATLVVMGMISFYVSSQSMWMAGSTQALAQRDATLLIETVSAKVRESFQAETFESPDSTHQGLILYDASGTESWRFWWDDRDSLLYQGPSQDQGSPVVASRVTRFQLDTLTRLVDIRLVEVRSGDGRLVRMSSAAALYSRGLSP
jgi:type II secretory pathway component PulJ